jgi:hypothetical protein
MSSEQSLDPQLVEQTKHQIRMLVNEISRLAKSEIAPEEFYGEFLPRVVTALAAVGGAVWVAESNGRLSLGYQINLQETRLRNSEEDQIRHGRLLHRVLTTGQGALVAPRSGGAGDDQGGNPTDFLLVLAPLKAAEETVGVVEVFQRPGTRPATQKGYLRFLAEMCDRAGEFFKTHQLRHFTDRQVLWTQLEEFARGVHASLDPRDTAYTIANDGRRLIECDRVTVAIRRGRRCHVEAVSGQDMFNKRSNTIRMLGKLATRVVASEEPVWYTGDTRNLPPQVEEAMQEYVDESHSKTVAVLPLQRPEPVQEEDDDDPDKREEPEPPIGALIVEQIEDSRIPEKMIQRVEVVCEHSSTALANSLEHNSLFLMPVWRTLGKSRWLVKARTLPKTVTVTVVILAVLIAMVVLPWGFKMRAKGMLRPVERREVFAEIRGEVVEVPVDHGDQVTKGQLLARLENTQLDLESEKNLSELNTIRERIDGVRRTLSQERLRLSDADRLEREGQLLELELREQDLLAQQRLYDKQKEDLAVLSPTEGQVITWDVENRLMSRPVERGNVLMRVANPDGPWELEVLMPDKRIGHVNRAYRAAQQRGEDLLVEFILMSDPDTTHVAKVKEISESAEPREDEGNVVSIRVEIPEDVKAKLPQPLRPGTEVQAKVKCGTRPLGYVLFHELIAFLQAKVLFRWF